MNPLHHHAGPAPVSQRLPAASVDETHMRYALELAWRALGDTDPNPIVGAIVVANGDVVGVGYHRSCGSAHAETVALRHAGERARGSTMYVTLEPCAHHGRTPPCVDAIAESGVIRVVIPTLDPDPLVYGRGVERLRASGIRVDTDVMAAEAIARNLGYYHDRLGSGPTVTLKMAVTMDGKIAAVKGRRDAITGPASLQFVHRMRSASDCVVVGVDTVIVDKPLLDCRFLGDVPHKGCLPTPVIFDTHLRVPTENTWAAVGREYVVVCGPDADAERERCLSRSGAQVIRCELEGATVSVDAAVRLLARLGFERIMVEGGSGVFSSFVDSSCWHALYLFQSPVMFGDGGVDLYRGRGVGVTGRLVDQIRMDEDTLHLYVEQGDLEDVYRRVTEQ